MQEPVASVASACAEAIAEKGYADLNGFKLALAVPNGIMVRQSAALALMAQTAQTSGAVGVTVDVDGGSVVELKEVLRWMIQVRSVRPSVRPSVQPTSSLAETE